MDTLIHICFAQGVMTMFTAEDYERAENIAPYGMVEESTGSGSFSWYQNPMWGMTQIGSFPEYYLSEYGDWIIENLKDEVEDNGFDVGRHSRKVPGYDRVLLENARIKSVKCRQTSNWSRPALTKEQCPVIQVDAIVTSDLILYQGETYDSDRSSQWFRVRTYYDLITGTAFDPSVSIYERESNPGGTALDDEMCPILTQPELEKKAEEILQRYYPEALNCPRQLSGEELARRIGLKVLYVNLGDDAHRLGRLYFSGQQVQVLDEDGKNILISVDPGTILLNNRLQGGDRFVRQRREDTILHECAHFLVHPCFYYFQQLHHEELAFLASDGAVPVFHGAKTPISRIERQASQVEARLRMPQHHTKQMISRLLNQYRKYGKIEAVNQTIRSLSKYYGVSYQMAKIRMTELGYPEARGVLNYIDGRYTTDYCVARNDKHVYAVTLDQLEKEYKRNPVLRKLLEDGRYLYIGGYVVRNIPEAVCRSDGRYRLTSTAQMDVSRYCVGFLPERIMHNYPYDPRSFHRDHEAHPDDIRTDVHHNLDEIMKLDDQYQKALAGNERTFAGLLMQYMTRMNTTVDQLVEETGISESAIKKYRTGERMPKLEGVLAICVVLGLSGKQCRELLQSAHIIFDAKDGAPYDSYSFIIDSMAADYSLDEVNQYLIRKELKPLSEPNTK